MNANTCRLLVHGLQVATFAVIEGLLRWFARRVDVGLDLPGTYLAEPTSMCLWHFSVIVKLHSVPVICYKLAVFVTCDVQDVCSSPAADNRDIMHVSPRLGESAIQVISR